MLSDTFWDTFWGGLASLAVFGLGSAIVVWIVARLSAPFRRKPSWLIETDTHGNTVLVYNRRKPCYSGTMQFTFRGEYIDPSDFETWPGEHTQLHSLSKGRKIYLPNAFAWDEVRIMWRESDDATAVGSLPQPNERNEIFTEYSGKPTLRQRFLNFLAQR